MIHSQKHYVFDIPFSGEINSKVCKIAQREYKIVTRAKKSSPMFFENYRSVVFSVPEMNLLCFSPPKSLEYKCFREKYDPYCEDTLIVNEIVEGIMINLFYDSRNSTWELATKTSVGGGNYFRAAKQSRTFRELFLDILRASKGQDVNDVPFVEELPKNYSYSFVMQHPETKILIPRTRKLLYLVAIYEIEDNCATYVPSTEYEMWPFFRNMIGIIDFPRRFSVKSYCDIDNIVLSIHNHHKNLGVTIVNKNTGERACRRNPSYYSLKNRRFYPEYQYQYLCLRYMKKVDEFLENFPQYKTLFFEFYREYQDFVRSVHSSYMMHYVFKEGSEISKKFMPHIYAIHHGVYLPSLKTHRVSITRKRVEEYFDAMEPREMLYHLNTERRELLSLGV